MPEPGSSPGGPSGPEHPTGAETRSVAPEGELAPGAPGAVPPAPARTAPAGRSGWRRGGAGAAAFTVAVFVAVAAAGAVIGHELWPGAASSREGFPGGFAPGFGVGPGRAGFGCGSSGFRGSGPCAVKAAAGAPADVPAISAKVDPGLVDVTSTFGFGGSVGAGTGIVLTPSGEVLTNNHVIDGATRISFTDVGNGKNYSDTVVGYDSTHDIAVLSLHGASGLRTAEIGDSGRASVGEGVVAIGNAGGLGGTPTSAGGSITALDQSITADSEGPSEQLFGLIEVNSDVQPGDSGGALVDRSGRVLGMTTAAALYGDDAAPSHKSYVIPIDQALRTANQIVSGHGSAVVHVGATAFLGVQMSESRQAGLGGTGSFAGAGSKGPGAAITEALNGEPAAKAGLAGGDVITSLDGEPVSSPGALAKLLARFRPGDAIELGWIDRAGKTHTSRLELASGPPA
jgi:S1-C subfamily serine protease